MRNDSEVTVHDALASLLCYPFPPLQVRAASLIALAQAGLPEAADQLATFHVALESWSEDAWEEHYSLLFDANAERALEIGWHLFGESYPRGELLVLMRNLLRDHRIDEASELPDHLSLALRLLPHLSPPDAAWMAHERVLPALEKILDAVRKADSPYAELLDAVRALVTRYPAPPKPEPHPALQEFPV